MDVIGNPREALLLLLIVLAAVVGLAVLWRVILSGSRATGTGVLPPKPFRRVLIPATSDLAYTDSAVSLACRLAGGSSGGASVVLTYLIEVPRSLALNADLPEEEARARLALEVASESVKRCGLQPVLQVRRSRSATEEALRAIKDENADLLVLMVPPDARDPNTPHAFAELTTELARRAPCEIVLARTTTAAATTAA